jgi:hypothetical protein
LAHPVDLPDRGNAACEFEQLQQAFEAERLVAGTGQPALLIQSA